MNANRYMRDSLRTADRSNMDRLKLECALGLCGEAGEVAEQVKKMMVVLTLVLLLMAVAEYFSIDPVWFLIVWYLSDNISA